MNRERITGPCALLLGLTLAASACAGTSQAPVAAAGTDLPAATQVADVATTTPLQTAPDDPATPDPATAVPETTNQVTPEPAVTAPEPVVAEPEPATPEPALVESTVVLPEVEVVDLSTGLSASLNSFTKPGATLLWFWAPH